MVQPINADDIKTLIEKTQCADHGTNPYIELSENKMTIKSNCCPRFQYECINLAKDLAQMLFLTDLTIE